MSKGQSRASQKERVAQQAGYSCEYCLSQARYSPDPFSLEHIIPRSAGGLDEADNLGFACQGCNNRKYNSVTAVDPITGEIVPLFHPRHDEWADHFAWDENFVLLIGLTPVGRATVAKLHLNREGVVNLRRVLRPLAKHPPHR